MSDTDNIEIPPSVLVHCPKVGFKLARLGKCVECESFKGLSDNYPGSQMHFAARYRAKCSFEPMSRQLQELDA